MQKEKIDTKTHNSASLVELKAELFKKQEEFKLQKLSSDTAGYIRGKPSSCQKKPSLFSKKNSGVTDRAEKDYEEKLEEEDVFERSKRSLENKALLYDQFADGGEIPEEDGSGLYLVDFQKKALNDVFERRERAREEKDKVHQNDVCQMFEPTIVAENDNKCEKRETVPNLVPINMLPEIQRQNWEKLELENMEKEGPIHYADIQHNEVRTHGVGFYKFDKDEKARQEQMEQLVNLREQTKEERSKSERIKEKRKATLAARLAKVKQRKRQKLGLSDTEEENIEKDNDDKLAEQKKVEPEPLTRDDSWRTKIQSTREWDRGKQVPVVQSEEAWLEKQRAERDSEFAPPTFYYEERTVQKPYSSGNQVGKFANIDEVTEQMVSDDTDTKSSSKIKQMTSTCNDTELKTKEPAQISVHADIDIHADGTHSFSNSQMPFLNVHPQFNFPPPICNFSSPSVMVPQSVYNISSPDVNFPPPIYYTQPPTFGFPPNMMAMNPSAPLLLHNQFSEIAPVPNDVAQSGSIYSSSTPSTLQAESSLSIQNQPTRCKFIPKMDIIDTRLMENSEDN